MQSGIEIAQKLQAQVWISAHDGDKEVSGASIKQLRIHKHEKEEVEAVVSPVRENFAEEAVTKAVVLEIGEEITLGHNPTRTDHGLRRKDNIVNRTHEGVSIMGSDFREIYEDLDKIMLKH